MEHLDARLLRAFVTVADELHFGRAATRLNLTQPALSRQVQQLERRIGSPLLVRGSHGVTLTEAGRVLRTDAERLLAQGSRALDRARRAGRGELGHLSVGFVGSALDVVVGLLGSLRSLHPDVVFTVTERAFREQTAGLEAGEDDAAFVRDLRPNGAFELVEIRREPLCLVVPTDHRLAARDRLTRRELLREVSRSPFVTTQRWMGLHGLDPDALDEVASTPLTLRLVAARVGLSYMPSGYRDQAPPDTVRFVPVSGESSVLQLAIGRRPVPPVAERFIALARRVAALPDDRAGAPARDQAGPLRGSPRGEEEPNRDRV